MCLALWTTTSRRPRSARIASIASLADCWERTSSSTVRRSTLFSAAYAAASATRSALRPAVSRIAAYTVWPLWASARALMAPKPEPAPVIRMTLLMGISLWSEDSEDDDRTALAAALGHGLERAGRLVEADRRHLGDDAVAHREGQRVAQVVRRTRGVGHHVQPVEDHRLRRQRQRLRAVAAQHESAVGGQTAERGRGRGGGGRRVQNDVGATIPGLERGGRIRVLSRDVQLRTQLLGLVLATAGPAEDRDARAHRGRVAHGHAADAADADHRDPRARLRARLTQAVERGDPRAHQRRPGHRVEPGRQRRDETGLEHGVLRVSAVRDDAGDALAGAQD